MLPSAIYDPCTHATPSQRLEAAARRERLERFERSAKTIARVHDVVELPVDKTQRVELPIIPEPEHFSISRIALLSARRTTDIVRPRQVAMYLCKNLTPKSCPRSADGLATKTIRP
jgi:chromosomal replication initiation ATPase DnaA